jgi:peroxiredoxin
MIPFLLALVVHLAAPASTKDLAPIRLLNSEGAPVSLASLAPGHVLVLAYTGVGCPLAARWAPRLVELEQTFRARGVRFVGVNANPQDSRAAIAREAAELGFTFPVLKDAHQELTRVLGASSTTEVFVLDAELALHYQGAIDDQHSLGGSKPEPGTRYLAEALEAVLAGREPSLARTEAPGCRLTLLAEDEAPEAPTWSEDVAPIVAERCAGCHRPSGGAPFALQTYEQARGWSSTIGDVIDEHRMPPWTAHERFAGRFSNERRLDDWQRTVLLRWVEQGAAQGEAGTLARSTLPEGDWRIGAPDAEFAMQTKLHWDGKELQSEPLPDEGYAVPRSGVVEYQYFATETDFASERWVRAIEIRPGARDVVHHVIVWAEDPEAPGKWLADGSFRSYFAATVPGGSPTVYGPGLAKRLPAGARLVFQIHYTPNGKERTDRTRVALLFTEEPALREVFTGAVLNTRLRIPAGAADHEVRGREKLDEDIELLALFPHMHLRGKDFRFLAHLPSGEEQDLLECRFDFNWQDAYECKEPVRLPRGTVLECVGHYDNSPGNPANPDPGRDVSWGDQTFEEMFIGYYDYVRAEASGSR